METERARGERGGDQPGDVEHGAKEDDTSRTVLVSDCADHGLYEPEEQVLEGQR